MIKKVTVVSEWSHFDRYVKVGTAYSANMLDLLPYSPKYIDMYVPGRQFVATHDLVEVALYESL